jgi:predicted nuclease of predicted toxin-antitoxin system
MKILLDMNLSPHWTQVLQEASFDAVHWSELGRSDAPDEEIMAYAAQSDFVVMTDDLDFSAILAATQGTKPSVVQIRALNLSFEVIAALVVRARRQASNDLQKGALLTIDVDRARLRLLPLVGPEAK